MNKQLFMFLSLLVMSNIFSASDAKNRQGLSFDDAQNQLNLLREENEGLQLMIQACILQAKNQSLTEQRDELVKRLSQNNDENIEEFVSLTTQFEDIEKKQKELEAATIDLSKRKEDFQVRVAVTVAKADEL